MSHKKNKRGLNENEQINEFNEDNNYKQTVGVLERLKRKKTPEDELNELPQEEILAVDPHASFEQCSAAALEELKQQVKMLNSGIMVHIVDVLQADDANNLVVVKARLMASFNKIPAFGEVKLRFAKQALHKLKSEISKISD